MTDRYDTLGSFGAIACGGSALRVLTLLTQGNTMKAKALSLVVLPIGLALAAGTTFGQGYTGSMVNAVGQCDGSLPSHDEKLRKRPTAIANEGDSNAFISCSMPHPLESDDPLQLSFFVKDPGGTHNAIMSCTMVAGSTGAEAPTPLYYTQSQTFTVNTTHYRKFEFIAADYGLTRFRSPLNLSCALPPGIELNDIFIVYGEP